MVDVSSRLRTAREQAGLTIAEISARTKIKAVQLEAIERGEFERLPGVFFTRAFLKNYAREVGLPPDEIVREYDTWRGVNEAPPEPAITVEPLRPVAARAAAAPIPHADVAEREPSPRGMQLPSPKSAWPALALALVLLLVISVASRQSRGSAESGAVAAAGTAAASAKPVATSGPVEKRPEILSMEITPSAVIWVNAKADGVQAIYRLVQPGERLKVEARNDLTFRIGNAAAFQYTLNGAPGRPLGGTDEVREFQITPDNFQAYRR